MDLTLKRTLFEEDGIFGELYDEQGNQIAVTLEHAYPSIFNNIGGTAQPFSAKIPTGKYKCVRGQHQLKHMTSPFTTFEVQDVPEHSNILFHTGNVNADSEGCILVGQGEVINSKGIRSIYGSRVEFGRFIELQKSVDSFLLTVV